MNDQRNMILAIALSALVLIGWTFLSERYFPTASPPVTKTVEGKQVALPQPNADPAADTPLAAREREAAAAGPRLPIETPRLKGSINLRGARIDDLVLTTHRESLAPNSPAIRLLSPGGTPDAYFASFGWTGEGLALPGADTVWTPRGNGLAPGRPLPLSWDNSQGQVFEIELSVDDAYLFTVKQRVTNRGSGTVAAKPYSLISRAKASKDPDPWTAHVGAVGVFNGAANYDWGYADIAKEGDQRFRSTGGWLGFSDKYWLTALIPDQGTAVEALYGAARAAVSSSISLQIPAWSRRGKRFPTNPICSQGRRRSSSSIIIRTSLASPNSTRRSTGAGSNGS